MNLIADASDEYREKWAYIRHVEQIRYRVTQWYVASVGALLAFTFTESAIGEDHRPLILGFLLIVSVAYVVFLLTRKRVYEAYVARVYALDGTGKAKPPLRPVWGVFSLFFYAISLVPAFVAAVFWWTRRDAPSLLETVAIGGGRLARACARLYRVHDGAEMPGLRR